MGKGRRKIQIVRGLCRGTCQTSLDKQPERLLLFFCAPDHLRTHNTEVGSRWGVGVGVGWVVGRGWGGVGWGGVGGREGL